MPTPLAMLNDTGMKSSVKKAGNDVRLWARKEEVAHGINADHVNPRYLADARLSERIEASTDIVRVVGGADAVVIVTPSSVMRETARAIAAHVGAKTPVALAAKGVEAETGMLPVEVFDEPTSGLDALNMEVVAGALETAAREGRAIIVVTHDNEFIGQCCTHIFELE